MAKWAYVENNEIKELHDLLPTSWRNVSGLRLSENDTLFLKSLGWFPVVKQHDEYNPLESTLDGYEYKIQDDAVVETVKLVPAEASSQEDLHNNFMVSLREERNLLLASCDWTQLRDVRFGHNEMTEWGLYRKKLRDLPSKYDDLQFVNLDQVEWPVVEKSNLDGEG
jgi:hypothetical protein